MQNSEGNNTFAHKLRDIADEVLDHFHPPVRDVTPAGSTSTSTAENPDKPPAVQQTTHGDVHDAMRERYGDVRGDLANKQDTTGLSEEALSLKAKLQEGQSSGAVDDSTHATELIKSRGSQAEQDPTNSDRMNENAMFTMASKRERQGEVHVRL
ncbi:hypothetical protein RI367_008056 [Sorochytrium milnesiophthora]